MVRFVIAAVITLIFTAAWAGDFEDGVAAIKRKDYATALIKFRNAAQQGSAAAQYNLGQMYRQGHGVEQDAAEAQQWYELAAKQGYIYAQYNLALMNYKRQEYQAALHWFQMAAKQGSAQAQYDLGLLYYSGKGVDMDHKQAMQWFLSAAICIYLIPRHREFGNMSPRKQGLPRRANTLIPIRYRIYRRLIRLRLMGRYGWGAGTENCGSLPAAEKTHFCRKELI